MDEEIRLRKSPIALVPLLNSEALFPSARLGRGPILEFQGIEGLINSEPSGFFKGFPVAALGGVTGAFQCCFTLCRSSGISSFPYSLASLRGSKPRMMNVVQPRS